MIGLRVEVQFHWGFWVRIPKTSRYASSLTIPPPTTLIGALAQPIVEMGFLGNIRGEIIIHKNRISSPAAILEEIIPACSFYYEKSETLGFQYVDLNKYITLHFHIRVKEKEGIRRYLMKFRTGAIKTGKVSCPSSIGVACYLINEEKANKLLGNDWRKKMEIAAWNISRIGSKESIVSVLSAEIIDNVSKIDPFKDVKTKCYVPFKYIDQNSLGNQKYYREYFWRGGWTKDQDIEFEEYLIPGTQTPATSETITIRLNQPSFKIGDYEVLCI